MPEITDWSDLTYDYVEVRKTYRPQPEAEPETVRFELRDDVPTSVMVRVFGIGSLEAKCRAALAETDADGQPQTPDYEAAAAAMERMEAEVLRALAGIFHHTYAETDVREWEAELARIFTGNERLALVQRFFTRSRALPTRLSASATRPATAGASRTTPTPMPRARPVTVLSAGRTRTTGRATTRGRTRSSEPSEPDGDDAA